MFYKGQKFGPDAIHRGTSIDFSYAKIVKASFLFFMITLVKLLVTPNPD
jgi:hypothetical protein